MLASSLIVTAMAMPYLAELLVDDFRSRRRRRSPEGQARAKQVRAALDRASTEWKASLRRRVALDRALAERKACRRAHPIRFRVKQVRVALDRAIAERKNSLH